MWGGFRVTSSSTPLASPVNRLTQLRFGGVNVCGWVYVQRNVTFPFHRHRDASAFMGA